MSLSCVLVAERGHLSPRRRMPSAGDFGYNTSAMQSYPSVDEPTFREAMRRLATGVAVVTTRLEGKLYGITVNAFCSVSLDPPLVLVCIDQLSRARSLIAESHVFAISILSWQQQFVADRFAARAPLVDTAFTGVPYRIAITGAPVLARSLAWADCQLSQTVPAGDHAIFVGAVVAVGVEADDEPLLFYNARFERLRPRS